MQHEQLAHHVEHAITMTIHCTPRLGCLSAHARSRYSSRRLGTWDGKSIIHPRNLWVRGSNLTGGHNRLLALVSCPHLADTALKPCPVGNMLPFSQTGLLYHRIDTSDVSAFWTRTITTTLGRYSYVN